MRRTGWLAARLIVAFAAFLLATMAVVTPGLTEDYPSRPIRMIVPFAPGGPTDILARAVAPVMSTVLGQSVIIENRAGAGGATGVDAVAKAAPDGYTIGMSGPGALVAIPFMVKVPYDATKDVVPIARIARVNAVIIVSAQSEFKTLGDLVAAAKAAPGKLSFGSAGAGTITHLAGELLNMEANIKLVHVPYRGAVPASTDLLGGHIQTMLPDLPGVIGLIRAGSVRALAVTSKTRSTYLPDVPTTGEAGYPNVLSDSWYGLIAPAGIPTAVMDKLGAAAVAAMNSDETKQQIASQGAVAALSTPREFADLIAEEQARWKRVIEATGAKME
jgi:tripartite-type tricarboxylate transporter receptor subunit TctC